MKGFNNDPGWIRRKAEAEDGCSISVGGSLVPSIPPRIARLPKDKRGYPIPWNVLRGVDDTPIFTVNDQDKHMQALRSNLCPICGERLGKWRWFVGGIRSAFDPNGAYYDLPGHHECETFALQICPYLALPVYLGRIDVPDPAKLPPGMVTTNITMIPERPDVFVSVASDGLEIIGLNDNAGTPVIRPRKPYLAYEFWLHGAEITALQALPILRKTLGEEFELPEVRR